MLSRLLWLRLRRVGICILITDHGFFGFTVLFFCFASCLGRRNLRCRVQGSGFRLEKRPLADFLKHPHPYRKQQCVVEESFNLQQTQQTVIK